MSTTRIEPQIGDKVVVTTEYRGVFALATLHQAIEAVLAEAGQLIA